MKWVNCGTYSIHDVSGLQHQMQNGMKLLTAHQICNTKKYELNSIEESQALIVIECNLILLLIFKNNMYFAFWPRHFFLKVFIWSHSLIISLQCPTAMQWKGHIPVEEVLRKSNKAQKASVTQLKWHRLKWGRRKKAVSYIFSAHMQLIDTTLAEKKNCLFEVRNTVRSA